MPTDFAILSTSAPVGRCVYSVSTGVESTPSDRPELFVCPEPPPLGTSRRGAHTKGNASSVCFRDRRGGTEGEGVLLSGSPLRDLGGLGGFDKSQFLNPAPTPYGVVCIGGACDD